MAFTFPMVAALHSLAVELKVRLDELELGLRLTGSQVANGGITVWASDDHTSPDARHMAELEAIAVFGEGNFTVVWD